MKATYGTGSRERLDGLRFQETILAGQPMSLVEEKLEAAVGVYPKWEVIEQYLRDTDQYREPEIIGGDTGVFGIVAQWGQRLSVEELVALYPQSFSGTSAEQVKEGTGFTHHTVYQPWSVANFGPECSGLQEAEQVVLAAKVAEGTLAKRPEWNQENQRVILALASSAAYPGLARQTAAYLKTKGVKANFLPLGFGCGCPGALLALAFIAEKPEYQNMPLILVAPEVNAHRYLEDDPRLVTLFSDALVSFAGVVGEEFSFSQVQAVIPPRPDPIVKARPRHPYLDPEGRSAIVAVGQNGQISGLFGNFHEPDPGQGVLQLDLSAITRFASGNGSKLMAEYLSQPGREAIDLVVVHQANGRYPGSHQKKLTKALGREVKVPLVQQGGNFGAASVVEAYLRLKQQGEIVAGKPVLAVSYGSAGVFVQGILTEHLKTEADQ